ncbi:MAG: hypothetical protein R3E32_25960 [Chitinophagales bacterium]
MSKEKTSLDKVVPESEKGNLDKYSDILKNPINELESKKETMNEALEDSDDSEE